MHKVKSQNIPVDCATKTNSKPVIDKTTDVDVAPSITIPSTDFKIAFKVL